MTPSAINTRLTYLSALETMQSAIAAVLMGAGIPAPIMRGFSVISRAAGLVAHVIEEQETTTGRAIWDIVDNSITYTGKADSKS